MNTRTAELEIEVATLRQGCQIMRSLNRLRIERVAQRLEQLERDHHQTTLPAAAAAGAGGAPTLPGSERDAAGALYGQVHVFPKGRWS